MSQSSTYEQLTVGASAVGISAGTLAKSGVGRSMKRFICRLETAQIRYRTDGTNPTASTGTLLEIGDILEIDNAEDAARIRFIRTGSSSGVLNIEGFQW